MFVLIAKLTEIYCWLFCSYWNCVLLSDCAANRADGVSIVESLADFNVDAASDINSDIGHVDKTVCKETRMSFSGEVLSSEPFMNKMNVKVQSFTPDTQGIKIPAIKSTAIDAINVAQTEYWGTRQCKWKSGIRHCDLVYCC